MTQLPDYRHVSILWATPEHSEICARLHAGFFEEPWDAASFGRLLTHPGSTALIARLGTPPEAAGFILGQVAADEAEILTLGVHVDHRRHRIAFRLVEAFGRAARKADARRLFLEVEAGNAVALGLYKKLGFQETGRRKAYYTKPGAFPADAVTLALTL